MNYMCDQSEDNTLESEGFQLLRSVYTTENVPTTKGHLEMAFQLLKSSLILLYGSTDINKFMAEKSSDEFCEKLSHILKKSVELNCWCRRTGLAALSSMRKL